MYSTTKYNYNTILQLQYNMILKYKYSAKHNKKNYYISRIIFLLKLHGTSITLKLIMEFFITQNLRSTSRTYTILNFS